MKKIDVNSWKGKKHYEWFKKYPAHYYGVTSRLDITKLVNLSKEKKYLFFICMRYFVVKGLNEVEEMRMRIIDDEPFIFDICHPAYAVMTESGVYDNCENDYYDDFEKFYSVTKESISTCKKAFNEEKSYNDLTRFDQFFITCLPWIDFTSLTHPMINDALKSIPRVCFGKYVLENGKYMIALNIQVTHALVDGYPLSQAFLRIQKLLDECNLYIK